MSSVFDKMVLKEVSGNPEAVTIGQGYVDLKDTKFTKATIKALVDEVNSLRDRLISGEAADDLADYSVSTRDIQLLMRELPASLNKGIMEALSQVPVQRQGLVTLAIAKSFMQLNSDLAQSLTDSVQDVNDLGLLSRQLLNKSVRLQNVISVVREDLTQAQTDAQISKQLNASRAKITATALVNADKAVAAKVELLNAIPDSVFETALAMASVKEKNLMDQESFRAILNKAKGIL